MKTSSNTPARQRLLETADRLFYQDGIRSVGIDRIIAEAGVAKMTLYAHFPSKDDLILEVLKHRDACFNQTFDAAYERHAKKKQNLLSAFFAALKERVDNNEFRGCPFINAIVEMGHSKACVELVRDQKHRFLERLARVVAESTGKKNAELTEAIGLLMEGAVITSQIRGSSESLHTAHQAALKLAELK